MDTKLRPIERLRVLRRVRRAARILARTDRPRARDLLRARRCRALQVGHTLDDVNDETLDGLEEGRRR